MVSALIPAREYYPCGNDGEGWLSVTVETSTGRPITLPEPFTDQEYALPAIAAAWFRVLAAANDWRLQCVVGDLSYYQPSAQRYRLFALTPRGLALALWQEPATLAQRTVPDLDTVG